MHKKRVYNKYYFYTTVRDKEKTKSIYLGSNYEDAKLKEIKLKKNSKNNYFNLKLPFPFNLSSFILAFL